jgi:uncharacterized sulfatase
VVGQTIFVQAAQARRRMHHLPGWWLGGERSRAPNIVEVFGDIGWGDFRFLGSQDVRTWSVARLVAVSIRFEHFDVNSPICSPSRVALSMNYPESSWISF